MPRKKRAESAAVAEDTSFNPAEFDTRFDTPKTAGDVARRHLDRQQTAAEIVHGVAESTRLPDDTPHADRHPPKERVIQSGLTFTRTDVLAGVKQGEGFRLVGNYKVREIVMAFDEKPSREVITALHDAGFTWKSADKLWTFTIGRDTAAQDRLHGERTFEKVAGMVRAERGITHGVGVS